VDPVDVIEQRFADLRDSLLKVGTVTGTSGQKVVCTVEGKTGMTYPRLTSYTPTNGDVILILAIKPGAWFVIGKPAV
jgi:hypothetical protein